ncbi:hypothetical protein G9A89_018417 [Geosiphon pyriformis]|nr:hypothetical protein G9A89_018417 [Geosiphon pyriformis]
MKETSYIDLDALVNNKIVDNTMPKKTYTHTYVLSYLSEVPKFDVMNNNDNILELLSSKFVGSKQLPINKSWILEKCSSGV